MAKSAGANKRNDENKINPGIKITLIAVAVLCVIMLAYSVINSMGILDRSTTAMTVGEDEISVVELKQYYSTARSNVINTYGQYLLMYGYDYTNPAFDSMSCMFDSTITWKQYFTEEAQAAAEEISILYQESQKAGYTMTEEDKANLESYMKSLDDVAAEAGMSTAKYVTRAYGSGTKVADVEAYQQKRVIASGYYKTVLESFGIDDAKIDAYYDEHSDDYDVLKYYLYDVSYETFKYDAASTKEGAPTSEEDAAAKTEAAKAAAKAEAEAVLAKLNADGSNFDKVCAENEGKDVASFATTYAETVVSSADKDTNIGAWLLNPARKTGDMEVIEDEGAMSVILYVGRGLSDDYTVAVRHILRLTETPASDATDEEKAEIEAANAEAKLRADSLLGEWKAGEATEESFAQLAKENSEDGSASNGGLYTGVYKGQMVAEFENWCFDESRKPGDTGIVQTTYGYHVMYFVEEEGLKYRSDIKAAMEAEAYNELLEGLKKDYTTVTSDKAAFLL